MKKAVATIVLCLPLLTGCGLLGFFKKPDPPVVPPERVVEIDERAFDPCKRSLPALVVGDPASGLQHSDILINAAAVRKTYEECRDKQDASIVLLKKFSNKDKE